MNRKKLSNKILITLAGVILFTPMVLKSSMQAHAYDWSYMEKDDNPDSDRKLSEQFINEDEERGKWADAHPHVDNDDWDGNDTQTSQNNNNTKHHQKSVKRNNLKHQKDIINKMKKIAKHLKTKKAHNKFNHIIKHNNNLNTRRSKKSLRGLTKFIKGSKNKRAFNQLIKSI